MKKILIVSVNNSLGGAEQYLKMLAENHLDQKVDLVFFRKVSSNNWLELEKNKKFNLLFLNNFSEFFGAGLFLLYCFFKRNSRYDYIYTSHVLTTSIVGLLLNLKLIKADSFVGRESTTVFIRFKGFKLLVYKALYNLGYKTLDLLICQTDGMRINLIENLPWLENHTKVETIPNPIDLNKIGFLTEEVYPLPEQFGDYIVSAGRLIDEKGFDILIESFGILKKDMPELKLVILGEGIKRRFLEEKIHELCLENDIYLKGFVINVFPYFKNAKLAVVSSRVEGFPNVLLQMMSQNTSVVSTKCCSGIEEIPGLFVSEINNAEDLYKQIRSAITKDTANNRFIFDQFLENRSIEKFINKVEGKLK